jgi:hypothetical protein
MHSLIYSLVPVIFNVQVAGFDFLFLLAQIFMEGPHTPLWAALISNIDIRRRGNGSVATDLLGNINY